MRSLLRLNTSININLKINFIGKKNDWKKSTEEIFSSFKELLDKTFIKANLIQPIINQKLFHEIENIFNTSYTYRGCRTYLKFLLTTEQIKLNQE